MSVLSRPDRRDYMSLPFEEIDWTALERSPKGLRLGLLLDAGVGLAPEPAVKKAVEAAARAFEGAGARVEAMPPFLTREMLDGLDRFWRMRAFLDLEGLVPERREKVLPYIREWAAPATRYAAREVFTGFSQMGAMSAAANTASEPYDYVLSPTAPMPAFPAELASPIDDPARPFEHIGFTVAYNMSGQPSVSINCGYTEDGLPIGLQITGRRFDDLGVLQLARAYEELRPPQRPWPR
jgi:aspartyl-tRNA(Asn)/glutamyl-tRNA(Gln) amidotransferase subunit A